MARLIATFANGTTREIKNSRRGYSHAWRWTATDAKGEVKSEAGFCSSYQLGMSASAANFNSYNKWTGGDLRNFEFEIVCTRQGA